MTAVIATTKSLTFGRFTIASPPDRAEEGPVFPRSGIHNQVEDESQRSIIIAQARGCERQVIANDSGIDAGPFTPGRGERDRRFESLIQALDDISGRLPGTPIASSKMQLLPAACGEK